MSTDRIHSESDETHQRPRSRRRPVIFAIAATGFFLLFYWTLAPVLVDLLADVDRASAHTLAALLLTTLLGLGLLAWRERRACQQALAGRLLAETRLRRAIDAAQTADDSRSNFLASVSHELRTPLNAIIGFTDFIRAEVFGRIQPKPYDSYVDNIGKSARRLLDLIQNVLDASEFESGTYELKRQALPLDPLIRAAKRDLEDEADAKGVTIETDVPGHLHIWADRSAIRRAIGNLLDNAVKYNRVGGLVYVTADEEDDGTVQISVRDTGPGIDRHTVDRSFDPFAQASPLTARTTEGFGLGLAVARHLTELHGGSVRLSSNAGVGTAATVRLPATMIRRAPAPIGKRPLTADRPVPGSQRSHPAIHAESDGALRTAAGR